MACGVAALVLGSVGLPSGPPAPAAVAAFSEDAAAAAAATVTAAASAPLEDGCSSLACSRTSGSEYAIPLLVGPVCGLFRAGGSYSDRAPALVGCSSVMIRSLVMSMVLHVQNLAWSLLHLAVHNLIYLTTGLDFAQ